MLKVGIIGVGSMGTQHFLRLMNKIHGATVTAVSDINEAHAKEVIALYPTVRFIADPIALINDPEVDAVVIVSIDSTHEEYCLEAIKCGKYIFCEKPLSASAEGAKKVVDAEIAGGKRLIQMGFNRRFDPAYEELKALVVSGKLGAPLVAHCAHRNANYPAQYDDVVAVTGTPPTSTRQQPHMRHHGMAGRRLLHQGTGYFPEVLPSLQEREPARSADRHADHFLRYGHQLRDLGKLPVRI